MEYTNADVFVYQILDSLVTKYDYKIVNVPRNKKDIWLANETHAKYPMIRLSAVVSTSSVFEQDYLSKIKSALSMVLNKNSTLLIINTNEASRSFVEGEYVQIIVNDEQISDASLLETFPDLRSSLHKVENNQSECARLTRHLESNQMNKLREAKKFRWKDAPQASIMIAVVMMAIFLLMELFIKPGYSDVAGYVVAGGYYKALVVYANEYWRIITTGFINLDLITVLFYVLILYQIGKINEKVYSKGKYMLIFFGSLIIGNVFPLLFNDNIVSMGMGAGIFGILGAFLVYIQDAKLYKNKLARLQINQIIMVALISMLLNGSTLSAQLGGLLAGLFISIIVYKGKTLKAYKKHFAICGATMLVMLAYFAIKVDTAYPEIAELNTSIVKKYKEFGLNDYADHIEGSLKGAYKE